MSLSTRGRRRIRPRPSYLAPPLLPPPYLPSPPRRGPDSRWLPSARRLEQNTGFRPSPPVPVPSSSTAATAAAAAAGRPVGRRAARPRAERRANKPLARLLPSLLLTPPLPQSPRQGQVGRGSATAAHGAGAGLDVILGWWRLRRRPRGSAFLPNRIRLFAALWRSFVRGFIPGFGRVLGRGWVVYGGRETGE